MEIQQKDNVTFAGYIHHFKMQLSNVLLTMTLWQFKIFVKGLWDAHTTTAKIDRKDPQTLAESIRLVEKLNAA